MEERERTDAGQFAETVTLEDVLNVFDRVDGPVITSSDVAGSLECTTEAARQKLTRLHDQGKIDKRKTGRTMVYWRTENDSPQDGHSTPVNESEPRHEVSPEPTPEPRENEPVTQETDALDDALDRWEPNTEADAKSARAQTRRTVEFLREHAPERFKAGELKDALADESSFSPRHWWERAVQPGLKELVEANIVEYRAGHHDYKYTGE